MKSEVMRYFLRIDSQKASSRARSPGAIADVAANSRCNVVRERTAVAPALPIDWRNSRFETGGIVVPAFKRLMLTRSASAEVCEGLDSPLPFSRWREKVPKADEGGAAEDNITIPSATLTRAAPRLDPSR